MQTLADRFAQTTYLVRRKVFTFLGAKFHIYDAQGQLILYSKMKAFKLKEDIRLYSGEDMTQELLAIRARQIIDFSAAYDVIDSATGQKIGAFKRKGWKSILKDEWIIMNAADQEVGLIKEDSTMAALARRFIDLVSLFFPQKFHVEMGGMQVCRYSQNFNPFVRKLAVDFSGDVNGWYDRRLGLAGAILLSAIEGRQT